MFRWEDSDIVDIEGFKIKMYRPIFEAEEKQRVPYENMELDHYAFKYLGTELFMYKILDLNFVSLIEEKFDLKRVNELFIPTKEKPI